MVRHLVLLALLSLLASAACTDESASSPLAPEETPSQDGASSPIGIGARVRPDRHDLYITLWGVVWPAQPGAQWGTRLAELHRGARFALADIEVCAESTVEGFATFHDGDFVLTASGGDTTDSTLDARWPYLFQGKLLPGDCARGYVTFPVSRGTDPASLAFNPFDEEDAIVVWSLFHKTEEESATPEPSVAGADLGEQQVDRSGRLVTVLGVAYPIAFRSEWPEHLRDRFPEAAFAITRVRACSPTSSAASVHSVDFSMQFASHRWTLPYFSSFGEVDLPPGRCIEGELVFPVPNRDKPAHVTFDSAPERPNVPLKWSLP